MEAVLGAARPLHRPGDRSADRGEVGAGGNWVVSLRNLGSYNYNIFVLREDKGG